jgi:hypothetical protein
MKTAIPPDLACSKGTEVSQRLGGVALGRGGSVERLAGIAHAGELTQLDDWARRNLPSGCQDPNMVAGHGEHDPHEVRFGTTRGSLSTFLLSAPGAIFRIGLHELRSRAVRCRTWSGIPHNRV